MVKLNFSTTGIGSLPHHNVDAALQNAFNYDIPFLPQIPVKNPREYMIIQALDGLPGLEMGDGGAVWVNESVWQNEGESYEARLSEAVQAHRYDAFEPTQEAYSAWRGFLFELDERETRVAKVQLAGPMTCQWVLKTRGGQLSDEVPGLSSAIFKLVLARSLAMVNELKQRQVLPIFYLDEPAFYGFTKTVAKHLIGITQLKLVIQTLQKEGAVVGLHCCSQTDWKTVLQLGLDIISLDSVLSMQPMVEEDGFKAFILKGGTMSWGVVPTMRRTDIPSFSVPFAIAKFRSILSVACAKHGLDFERLLREAIYTPACGLALHSIGEAERASALLKEFVRLLPHGESSIRGQRE